MKCVIIGAGRYGEVYLSFLCEAGYEIIGFLDDTPEKQGTLVLGLPVLGTTSILSEVKRRYGVEAVFCPLGNNNARLKFLKEAQSYGLKTPNYIHPMVNIAPDVTIGDGVYILMGTAIMPHTKLSDFVMISQNTSIGHHTTIDTGVFVSSGVNIGAGINLKPYAYIGIGVTIMTGVSVVGEDSLIGAGAVVIKDVPEKAVLAGVPAKVLRFKQD